MSLHPRHAEAILDGRKTVEFRRRPFAQTVDRVMIYATQPVGEVVGEFTVAHIDVASPAELWDRHGDFGAITRLEFDRYFEGALKGVAISVAHALGFAGRIPLSAVAPGLRPPQSYLYVD
jgi:predicted transcriptional regulator